MILAYLRNETITLLNEEHVLDVLALFYQIFLWRSENCAHSFNDILDHWYLGHSLLIFELLFKNQILLQFSQVIDHSILFQTFLKELLLYFHF